MSGLPQQTGVLELRGTTVRLSEPTELPKRLRIVGPGTLEVETLGPALIVGGGLTLEAVRVTRVGGSGGLVQVLPKGRLTLIGGGLSGAVACVGYPPGVDPLGPAIENHGELRATGVTFTNNDFAAVSGSGSSRSALGACVFRGGRTYYVSVGQDADLALQDCTFDGGVGELSAALAAMGNASAVVQGGRFTGGACATTSNGATRLALSGVAFTGQSGIAVQTWGESVVVIRGCSISDADGWAIAAYAGSSVDVSETVIAKLTGCAVSLDGRAMVRLGPGARVEAVGRVGAVACGASHLVLEGASVEGAVRGVEATGVATVEEQGATVSGGEPRGSFVLAWWIGAVPEGPEIDGDTVIRWVWERLSDACPSVEDRRAVLDALPARVEWAWADGSIPPLVASLVALVRAEASALSGGGQAALDAVLLRGDAPEHAGIRRLLGVGAPLAAFDWPTVRRVSLPAPATALCGDIAGRLWSGDANGQVTCDGRPVRSVRAPIVVIAVGPEPEPTVAVELSDGIVWFDAATTLVELRSASSACCHPVPRPGPELEYTDSDTSGHPTDRCTRVLRIRPGQLPSEALQVSIEQGQTRPAALTEVGFEDGSSLKLAWGGLVLCSPTGVELGRWPGERVVSLGASGEPPGAARRAWIGLADALAVLIEIRPVVCRDGVANEDTL